MVSLGATPACRRLAQCWQRFVLLVRVAHHLDLRVEFRVRVVAELNARLGPVEKILLLNKT